MYKKKLKVNIEMFCFCASVFSISSPILSGSGRVKFKPLAWRHFLETDLFVRFGRRSYFAFSDGHPLRHGFDGNSSAGHLDVDEERRRRQAGAIRPQQVDVSITWWNTPFVIYHFQLVYFLTICSGGM